MIKNFVVSIFSFHPVWKLQGRAGSTHEGKVVDMLKKPREFQADLKLCVVTMEVSKGFFVVWPIDTKPKIRLQFWYQSNGNWTKYEGMVPRKSYRIII